MSTHHASLAISVSMRPCQDCNKQASISEMNAHWIFLQAGMSGVLCTKCLEKKRSSLEKNFEVSSEK